jgi:hypothetical protein
MSSRRRIGSGAVAEEPEKTVDSCLVLDSWKLACDGCLVGGWSGSIQWTRGGQVRSTLVVSRLPVEARRPALAGGDPTLAYAILVG